MYVCVCVCVMCVCACVNVGRTSSRPHQCAAFDSLGLCMEHSAELLQNISSPLSLSYSALLQDISAVDENSKSIQGGDDSQDALSLQFIFCKRARGARRRSALARSCRALTGLDQSNEDC